MATSNVAGYYKVTMWINYKSVGWSESLDVPASSDSQALTILLYYARHRQWTLPTTCKIVYGRISKVPRSRYSVPSTDLPLTGSAASLTTPNTNDMNDPCASLCLRYIADEGKGAQRFIHGLPDDAIAAMALTLTAPGGAWSAVDVAIGDGTANPGTLATALKNLLNFIAQNSYCASQRQSLTIGGGTALGYRMRMYTGFMVRDIRKKNVGRPFGMFRGKQPIR